MGGRFHKSANSVRLALLKGAMCFPFEIMIVYTTRTTIKHLEDGTFQIKIYEPDFYRGGEKLKDEYETDPEHLFYLVQPYIEKDRYFVIREISTNNYFYELRIYQNDAIDMVYLVRDLQVDPETARFLFRGRKEAVL